MAIYKIVGERGVRWGIDFYDQGKRIKKIIGSRQDALDAYALLKADSLEGRLQIIRKSDMTFQELTRKYLEYGNVNGKKSLARDVCSVKALMSHFRHMKITQINPLHIESYKKKRLESGRKSGTVNRELAALSHMFNLARKWKLTHSNPMQDVRLLKEEKFKMRILDRIEASLLIAAAVSHLKPILIVALNTGLRRGEVLGLSWNDVDFVNYTINVKNTKSGKDRIIPMNAVVAKILKEQDMSSEWIFPHPQRRERAMKDVSYSLKTACNKIGIDKFRFHDLRHTSATWMVNAGVDLVTIKEILGHSTIQMTMIYCHSSQESKRKAVLELEKISAAPDFIGRSSKIFSNKKHLYYKIENKDDREKTRI